MQKHGRARQPKQQAASCRNTPALHTDEANHWLSNLLFSQAHPSRFQHAFIEGCRRRRPPRTINQNALPTLCIECQGAVERERELQL